MFNTYWTFIIIKIILKKTKKKNKSNLWIEWWWCVHGVYHCVTMYVHRWMMIVENEMVKRNIIQNYIKILVIRVKIAVFSWYNIGMHSFTRTPIRIYSIDWAIPIHPTIRPFTSQLLISVYYYDYYCLVYSRFDPKTRNIRCCNLELMDNFVFLPW